MKSSRLAHRRRVSRRYKAALLASPNTSGVRGCSRHLGGCRPGRRRHGQSGTCVRPLRARSDGVPRDQSPVVERASRRRLRRDREISQRIEGLVVSREGIEPSTRRLRAIGGPSSGVSSAVLLRKSGSAPSTRVLRLDQCPAVSVSESVSGIRPRDGSGTKTGSRPHVRVVDDCRRARTLGQSQSGPSSCSAALASTARGPTVPDRPTASVETSADWTPVPDGPKALIPAARHVQLVLHRPLSRWRRRCSPRSKRSAGRAVHRPVLPPVD